ncbi:MAG: ABC transporter permease [Anaerolineae bacterium]|jgi:ABC-2 type transport system permease protein
MREQIAKAWYIARKDMRTYYLKPPLISWGMLFPAVMILAFYLRDPGDIRAAAPGLIGMTMLFGATSVEAVVIAFEKRIGAMERLMMAPVSIATMLAGKTISGALFGTATGVLVWLLSSAVWRLPLAGGLPLLVIVPGSVAFALMGVLVSLVMREVFDAMAMSNFFRFPMIFLCGVFMPLGAMMPVLRGVAALLPLTYTVDGLRHLLMGGYAAHFALWIDLLVPLGFCVGLSLIAYRLMAQRLEDLI